MERTLKWPSSDNSPQDNRDKCSQTVISTLSADTRWHSIIHCVKRRKMLDGLFNGFVCSKETHRGSNLQREDLTEWAYEGALCVCACVPTAWEGCLRKVHPILLLQEKSPYSCKIIANNSLKIGHLEDCNTRDQISKGRFEDGSCVRWEKTVHKMEIERGRTTFKG